MKTETQKLRRDIEQLKSRTTIRGRLNSLLANARSHSIPRGHGVVEIDIDYLMEQWEKQQGICAYTGWPMNTITKSPQLVSIERKDNAVGYTRDNCVLVCWIANNARGTSSFSDFVAMCKAVSKYQKGKTPEPLGNTQEEQTFSPVIETMTRTITGLDPVDWQVFTSFDEEIAQLIKDIA
jgi:hypothetical protein